MQGFAPADEVLLFRQKDPKPFLPVRVPPGAWSTTPNQDGSGTRCAQTTFAERSIRGGGPAAPNAGNIGESSYFANEGVLVSRGPFDSAQDRPAGSLRCSRTPAAAQLSSLRQCSPNLRSQLRFSATPKAGRNIVENKE